jgi:hypothetical protein
MLQGRSTIETVRFESDPVPDYLGVQPDQLPYD